MLPLLQIAHELGRKEVGEVTRIRGNLHDLGFLIRHFNVVGVFLMQLLNVLHGAFGIVLIVWRFRNLLDPGHEEWTLVLDLEKLDAADSFQHYLKIATGQTFGADDAAERCVFEEFIWSRILNRGILVGRNRDEMTGDGGFFHRMDASRSTELNSWYRARENHVVAQRQQRYRVDSVWLVRSVGAHDAETPGNFPASNRKRPVPKMPGSIGLHSTAHCGGQSTIR